MKLLRELLEIAADRPSNDGDDSFAFQTQQLDKYAAESVDNIADTNTEYVPLIKKKAKKRRFPTSDRAENSLINTQWFYSNSDAS